MNVRLCVHKAKLCAETAATKSHFAYLAVCTVLDGHLLLRLVAGSCLAFCVLGEVLKEHEEERQ